MNKKLLIVSLCFFLFLGLIGTTTVSAQYYDEDDSFLGALCILYLIIFIIWIVVGIWVYKDAERRGKSGGLWFIIIIFLGLIGIIIWLLIRPPIGGYPTQQPSQSRMCPNCGRPIPMDAKICPYCGKNFQAFISAQQQPTIKYCPQCGFKNKMDAKFCEDCGSQL